MSDTKVKFKETEIGLIFEDREFLKVKDVADINSRTINKQYEHAEIEYLDTSSTDNGQILEWQKLSLEEAPSRAKRILRKNDIVISTVRPNLKHFAILDKVNDNSVGSTGYAVITATKCNPKFLYYQLTTDEVTEYLSRIADSSVSTYPSIRPEIIANLELSFPDIEEQQKIAEVLGALDERIELNRKMNKTLESIGQAIFNHMFCHSELDSESSEMTLGDIAEITSGKRPEEKSSTMTGEFKIPLVGASSVMGYVKKPLYGEEIIITGRVGTHGILQRINYPCWPSDNTLVIKSQFPNYIYYVMKTFDFNSLNRGSTQPLITQTDLKNYSIGTLDRSTIRVFEEITSVLNSKVNTNNKEMENLSQTRDSLMPRLMSGKLRISDVQ